jgi:hypothetical protein
MMVGCACPARRIDPSEDPSPILLQLTFVEFDQLYKCHPTIVNKKPTGENRQASGPT